MLIAGGLVGLGFQAWGLAAILLLIGLVAGVVEMRAHRRRIWQTKQNFDTYEIGMARGADAAQQGVMLSHQGGM